MTLPRIALITSLLALVASTAFAGTIRVGPNRTYTTIQDGVDNASDGDTILIDKGVYVETVIVATADLTIKPAKKGKKGKVTIEAGGAGSPLNVTAPGVVLKDLHVSNVPNGAAGIAVGWGNADIELIRCTVMGGAEDIGIYVDEAPNCLVSKCKVFNAGDIGIQVGPGTEGTVVTKCTVKDAAGNGIDVLDTSAITITDNKVIRSGDDGILLGRFADTFGCLISGNTIDDSGRAAIPCWGWASQCVVENNILRGNHTGIEMFGSEELLFTENRVDDSLANGFYIDCTVTTFFKNTVTDSAENNYVFDSPSYLNLIKNKSRGAGVNGFDVFGDHHVLIKNDSRKSGQVDPVGLDFYSVNGTDCVYVGNTYGTSDFP